MANDAHKPGGMISVEDALTRVLDGAQARFVTVETIPVAEACGRILAADLAAKRTQPPFDMSAMDGFAVRAADTTPPRALTVIGESAAGHPFTGRIQPGEATRIFTGARVPEGADCILIQEDAEVSGRTVTPHAPVALGRHIRRAGLDFTTGETLLTCGTMLSPGALALAAGMNHPLLPVAKRPLIAILATGDELAQTGSDDADATIATNALAIAAMARLQGADVLDLGIARDTRESLIVAFEAARAAQVDCLVTIGGASVGKHDLVRPVAQALGASLDFYKIAMRPGKPLSFGALGDMLLLGLPGNPVSSMVCAQIFLKPLIMALQGATLKVDASEPAFLTAPLPANDQRQDYMRATLSRDDEGRLMAHVVANQDSSLLAIFARAEALVIRPPHAPAAESGEQCRLLRI